MDEFVKLLEGLAEDIGDTRALELINKATEIQEGYEEDIKTLNDEKTSLKRKLSKAEEERDEFENEICQLEGKMGKLLIIPEIYDNIITRGFVENIFQNLDKINASSKVIY
ncbi:hypothetical protein [Flavobacterium coralii]|uniref:hypothetical protein n=1 Tax=Flavobacterium coralii TaxID=2838017 RepID=UPI000C5D5724|nr:hypothetical protein [Flavobacterium sp.]|tara:strand:- start:436 stop:768 length:333 start_codon:yes stop_codon:yes gene_type:complete